MVWYGQGLWKIRGFMDKLFGPPGLRRGRRHPEDLKEGIVRIRLKGYCFDHEMNSSIYNKR